MHHELERNTIQSFYMYCIYSRIDNKADFEKKREQWMQSAAYSKPATLQPQCITLQASKWYPSLVKLLY